MPKNNFQNQEQNRRLIEIEGHINTINSELGSVKVDISQIKTDISWIVKFFWIIATASLSGLIVGIINLLFK